MIIEDRANSDYKKRIVTFSAILFGLVFLILALLIGVHGYHIVVAKLKIPDDRSRNISRTLITYSIPAPGFFEFADCGSQGQRIEELLRRKLGCIKYYLVSPGAS